MNFLKRFIAFAVAVVMICGALPVSALAVETHDHSDHSDIQPFTSTADLIEQVKAQLAAQGKTYAEETADQNLVKVVESKSDYSYNQAETMLGLGFFNDRTGTEGKISTAHLNLDEATMTALVESTLKAYYLDGIVTVEYVVEDGIVTAVTFSMRESFAAGLDEIETGVTTTETEPAEEAEAAAVAAEEHQTAVAAYSVEAAAEKAFPFTDVPASHWARTPINYLYQRSIVNGVSTTKYGPDEYVTRAQAVTMIWRAMQEPSSSGKNPFVDVKSGKYYTAAVIWAAENGIVNGTDSTHFSPSDNITREQLVAIIYRLAKYTGVDVSETASISGFKDAGRISSYAVEAVKWSVAAELVNGYEDSTFRPKGNATRAEYAKILYKYLLIPVHELVKVNATASTCTKAGNIQYWVCSECGKYFADDAAKKEITQKDTVLALDPNAHSLKHVEAVPSSCSTKGNIEYWVCTACGKYFADAEGKKEIKESDTVAPVDPTVHNPVPVAEVSPTCTTTGVAAHYKCECGLIVNPSTGAAGYDLSELGLILPATGHYPAEDDENTVFNWTAVETDDTENYALYFDAETGEITSGYAKIVTWTCDSVTFTCTGCGETFTEPVTVDSYVMTEEWINNQLDVDNTEGVAYEIAYGLISDYVTNKAMAYYGETGTAPSQDQLDQWAYEASQDPEVTAQMEAQITMAAYQMYMDLNSTIYVATCEGACSTKGHEGETVASFSEELNATKIQLQKDWATMCSFNEYYSDYFGLVAPYWSSKNTESSPFGAVIYMCSQEEQPFIPNYDMDYMISMLTQAFMSYVYSYADLLDGMIEDALAQVAYDELDDIDKLLLLHDWLAKYGTFDMQSLVDITTGESSGNDPIAMTAFGVLLNDQIEKDETATWDGGVCLGYAATYALLIQQAFGMEQDDEAMVDFVKIQFLTNVAESSVASGDSGFGDGDAMFNSAHYLNAVRLDDTWYYIDACYDDINTEVISQERVETDGNVSHTSFLLAPATWEEMYEENFQYMDSLYDGKVWQRVSDGEGGYVKMDAEGNQYTESEADEIQENSKDEDGNVTVQMFYYYEATETDSETRYEDTTYEEAWFVAASSAINYDPDTQYFYFTSGAVTSYSTLKDMFGDDEDDSSSSMGDMMDQSDMMGYKYDASAQDKIVRRPVNATNIPSDSGSDSSMSMSQTSDEYCEVLFHFGYGTTGAEAHAQYEEDMEDSSFNMGSDDEEEIVTGAWYDLCEEDAVYLSNYPDLVHSTVIMDGKIYFNISNYIYTFNYTIEEMSKQNIDALTTLELVKVKEYNEVSYTSNGKRFTGMSFEVASNGSNTLTYHPIAALSVHKDFKNDGAETLYVSLGTNFSNSYKDSNNNAYTVEARNFNPDYYRWMEDEEEDAEETNTNAEFMWCANVVEKMVVSDLVADLTSTDTEDVHVDAYCGKNAFTEERTAKFGLSVGEKVEEEDTALNHNYVADETEGTNICSVCLEDHDHDFGTSDVEIVIEWSEQNDGTLDAEAYVVCVGEYCGETDEAECEVTGPDADGVYTATATYGTITKTAKKTVEQFRHNVHDYAEPVFAWVEGEDGTWTATATFTCQADESACVGSDAEGEREVVSECTVTANNGEQVATVTGPDGVEYTDTLHVYSNETDEDGNYNYVTITMDESYDTFEAVYTCTVCEHTHTVTGTVDKDPKGATCTEDGLITATATASAEAVLEGTEGKTDSALPKATLVETKVIEATGHKYVGSDTDGWAEDYSSCTVTYTCSGCGDSYTRDAEVEMTEKVEATCETDGSETYTATVKNDDGEVRDTFTKVKTIKATGHTYGEAVVKWTYLAGDETTEESMSCSVKYVCEFCEDEDVMSVTKPVKGEDGVWTASYVYNGETITVTHTHATEGTCDCVYTAE